MSAHPHARGRLVWAALPLALSVALGCGGAQGPRGDGPIERLRARHLASPDDLAALKALAVAELFLDGGDPTRATALLERAVTRDADDALLRYAAGQERNLHGTADEALPHFVAALTALAAEGTPADEALAEAAAGQLESLAEASREGPGPWAEALAPLVDRAHRLGAPARFTVHRMLADEALRRGDAARARALQAAAGCPARWRVVGPFGPRVLLGFDTAFAPEADALRGARYDLSPGQPPVAPTDRTPLFCAIHLGGGVEAKAGTFYAATDVSVAAAGAHVLRLDTPNAAKVWVDGVLVASFDARRRPVARTQYVRVALAAGAHRVLVKLTTRHPNPVLGVAITPATAGGVDGEHGTPAHLVTAHPASYDAVAVERWLQRGDAVTAREHLRTRVAGKHAAVAALLAAVRVAEADPALGEDARRDEMRTLAQRARSTDPSTWLAALVLARLEVAEGRAVRAIELLEEARRARRTRLEVLLHLASFYVARDLDAQADALVDEALAFAPKSLAALSAARSRALKRKDYRRADALSDAMVRADAGQRAKLDVLVRQRRWDEAAREVERLGAMDPEGDLLALERDRLRIARGRGDDKAVQETLARMRDADPDSAEMRFVRVDELLAAGDRPQASRALEGALHEPGGVTPAMLRVADALFGAHPLKKHRLDGRAVIRDFVKSKRTYDQPAIMVLDYTVMSVEDDGTLLELTHNIWRVQSEEGLDELGEYRVPEGADLFTLRTHKADGRVLEPDTIEGKDTLSLPELKPGDFVEAEYLRVLPPNQAYPGGFLTWRFFFESPEEAFDRTELTVIVPRRAEVVVETRGDAPRLDRRVEGSREVLHWLRRQSPPVVPEPQSVPSREFMASVQVSQGATWPAQVEALRDALVDESLWDPALARLAQSIVEGHRADDTFGRAKALYDWVLDNLQHEGDLFGSAPVMITTRSGHRARAFQYLAELVGLRADLAFVHTLASMPGASGAPDTSDNMALLVRVETSRGPVFASLENRSVPFGYVWPLVRQGRGWLLAEGARAVELDGGLGPRDSRRMVARVDLGASGEARIEVDEVHDGASAISWRNTLEEIPAALLRDRFGEGYVARLVPGAELTELDVEGAGERDTPLKLHYAFTVRELGRGEGDRRVVGGLLPTLLVPLYAQLATRTRPALVSMGQHLDLTVELRNRAGGALPEPPATVHLEGPGGARFDLTSKIVADAMVQRRLVHVPVMRVRPEDYGRFADFCREADRAEARELAFPVRPNEARP